MYINNILKAMQARYFLPVSSIILLALIGSYLRMPAGDSIMNIDEIIPLHVHANMQSNNNLNTDWGNVTPELPYEFGKVRFNFSGYMLYSYLLTPAQNDSTKHLSDLRRLNRIYFVATLIVFTVMCSMLGAGFGPTSSGLVILTIAPGLVHDAQMARPESFLTLIVCLVILGSVIGKKKHFAGYIVAGLALGTGIATKLIFAILALPLLYSILESRHNKINYLTIAAIAVVTGFILAAPYAVVNPEGFIDGLKALNSQYSGEHYPHSAVDGSTSIYAQISFFMLVYGFVFFSPVAMAILYNSSAARFDYSYGILLSLVAAYLILFIFLGLHPVFFERNFHPFIVIMALSSVIILNKVLKTKWQIVISIIMISQLLYWTCIIQLVERSSSRAKYYTELEEVVKNTGLQPTELNIHSNVQECGLFRQVDYNDQISLNQRQAHLDKSYRVVASHISSFNILPTSTLHTYLDQNIYILYKECN
jgi:hypothetical protein